MICKAGTLQWEEKLAKSGGELNHKLHYAHAVHNSANSFPCNLTWHYAARLDTLIKTNIFLWAQVIAMAAY